MNDLWWVFLTLIASFATALTVFFDNYIVDVYFKKRSPFSQKIVYAFLSLATALIIALFWPIENIPISAIIFIMLSGAAYALALIPYYFALQQENSTASEIFYQTAPIFTFILGALFLGENLDVIQAIAFALILIADLVVIMARRGKDKKASFKAAALMIIAAIIWALSDLFFAKSGEEFDFVTTLMYMLLGRAVVDFVVVAVFKKERDYCFKMLKKKGSKVWGVITIDFIIEIVSDLIYRFALLMAPIALVSALESTSELVFAFLLGLILTAIWPKFGREKLDKRTISSHLLAIAILVVAILLLG